MSAGTDTIEFLSDKIQHAMDVALARRAGKADGQPAKERQPFSPRAYLIARILCWVLAGACGVVGFVLTGFHWNGVPMPTGLISWLAAFMTLGVILEGKVQAAAHRQQIRDEHNETQIGHANLTAQVRAVPAAVHKQGRELLAVQGELARQLAAAPTAVQKLVQDLLVAAEHQRLRHEQAMKDLLEDVANCVRHMETRLQAEPVELMSMVAQAVDGAESRMLAAMAKLLAGEREASAVGLEDLLKRVFAQGYVAGVRERHNGEGARVVQFPQAGP